MTSKNFMEVFVKLGYSKNVTSKVSKNIRDRIKYLHIDTQHFVKQNKTDNEIFVKNSLVSQHMLRNHYIKGDYSKYICSICGLEPIWNDKPLTLILDHLDGDSSNCELQNLRWVCPNCNQQLDTTGYKKIRVKSKPKVYLCHYCGCQVSKGSVSCRKCKSIKRRSENYPTKQELQEKLQEFQYNFTQIGKFYGVSDNAVRKWCKCYGLIYRKKDIC